MTGNYGSEIVRGSVMFKPSRPCELLFNEDFNKYIDLTTTTYAKIKQGHPISFIAFKQAPWFQYGRLALEQSQLPQRTPYMDNELVQLMYLTSTKAISGNAISLRLIADFNYQLHEILTDRGVGGSLNGFFSTLARAYCEFLFKMDYYYNHGMPQWLAKLDHAFSFLQMEKLFLGRHKYNHFRVWFRDKLSDYVREILLDKRTTSRPYINANFLETMVSRHIKGDRNYTNEISMLLTVELLHRLLIDNS
jgi:asparagine synthase (glutamine-hydrolysing)